MQSTKQERMFALIEQKSQSNDVASFCKEHGIGAGTYYYWLKKYREQQVFSPYCKGMLSLHDNRRYYLYRFSTDMRKSFDGLSGLVKQQMNQQILGGTDFLPRNELDLVVVESIFYLT